MLALNRRVCSQARGARAVGDHPHKAENPGRRAVLTADVSKDSAFNVL